MQQLVRIKRELNKLKSKSKREKKYWNALKITDMVNCIDWLLMHYKIYVEITRCTEWNDEHKKKALIKQLKTICKVMADFHYDGYKFIWANQFE